ncbi:isopenicillin N synthase-like dioxygenase [Neorhizobium sp. 2083]|uniref:2OG-Fe(II) oxygenase family protein n=1 Tax=Neorhizobium sp. 2083 TaxID=2817762 RepID=UPI0028668FBD|nr:2OG-Fe(II) oxygenase family protein [Neorhizobium sp. 2083]MDR6819950.1 isopenicillin N synthase-like dioxygenase [Neorhizobium sp. 2083]
MSEKHQAKLPSVVLPTSFTSDEAKQCADIAEVSRTYGYFFLENHGIPAELLSDTIDETIRFYSQPDDQKAAYKCSPNSQFLGYRPLGAEKSLMHAGGEACEQYRIGNVVQSDARLPPVDQEFFHQPFQSGMTLFQEMAEVGNRLMSACAVGLGLSGSYFDKFLKEPLHRLGLNYYEVGAGEKIGNTVSYAMSAHIDHTIFTVLAHDQPGLEVLTPEGDWLEIPVIPGSLFVFHGDYLQRWTNGQFRAVKHRVGEITKNRVSLQYKHKPSNEIVVAPLDPFVNESDPAKYQAFDTGREYQELLKTLLVRETV